MSRANAHHQGILSASPAAYSSREEFLSDLHRVLQTDYGVELDPVALQEAGQSCDAFLRTFLNQ